MKSFARIQGWAELLAGTALALLAGTALALLAASAAAGSITKAPFGKTKNGQPVSLYTLTKSLQQIMDALYSPACLL